jgi:flagellum-specific ATP synthase
MMIQAGLYSKGTDEGIDASIDAFPKLDSFLTQDEIGNANASFERLAACLESN